MPRDTEPKQHIISAPSFTNGDPLGIRKVILGGDTPGLASEARFLARRTASADGASGEVKSGEGKS